MRWIWARWHLYLAILADMATWFRREITQIHNGHGIQKASGRTFGFGSIMMDPLYMSFFLILLPYSSTIFTTLKPNPRSTQPFWTSQRFLISLIRSSSAIEGMWFYPSIYFS
ncbi:hypothetical protein Hanom_Chr07g00637781 [Helianthus anomalus]